MGTSNMELVHRLQRLERRLENYNSSIEPKSGEFIGQNWYNTSTKVLNVWDGRGFTPAYGSSIISDLNGFETRIAQNENDIALEVVHNDDVISKINLSSEGVNIAGDNIQLDGDVTILGSFTIDQINDGSTYKRTTQNEKTGASRGYEALDASSRYTKWLYSGDITEIKNKAGLTGVTMDSDGITGYKSGVKQFELSNDTGDAYFRGEIAASSGYLGSLDIDGTLTMDSSSGEIQSSNFDGTNGWLLDDDGLFFGVDKEISMRPGAVIEMGYYGTGPKLKLESGTIELKYSSLADSAFISSDYDGALLLWRLQVSGDIHLSGSSNDIVLESTNNRIKAPDDTYPGELYYNGEYWRILDKDGWRTL